MLSAMKKSLYILFVLLLLAGSFLAGSWYSHREPARGPASEARRVLYYVDPMNPSHTSDKPGLAPCGMKMEPVYADDAAGQTSGNFSSSMPPGTVKISAEKQQVIGVRIGQVKKTSGRHTLRTLGRVAPDETRIYRINSATDGWVKKIFPVTTGSLVKKDELLATFFSPEFFSGIKAYLYGLRSLDRFEKSGKETKEQLELTGANIESYRNSLRNLGMTEHQMDEIMRTRQSADNIEIRAPAAGFILTRNLTLGERFQRGTELYRIADLSQVWILADIFENESKYLRPGTVVKVKYPAQNKTFHARVSDVLPQFDPATRTLKIRIEADNPSYALRPDMFVDVEFPIQLPPAITVPVDAVLDSGLKKTVFVDRGNGFFEPRQVETGWRFGDRVEIVKGLMSGERIVISSTFLLDSESRMKMAASGMSKTAEVRAAKDPVCGMDVDENKARAAGRVSEYRGKTYYFCADECKQQFDRDHKRNVDKPTESGKPSVTLIAQTEHKAKDPICGMFVAPSAAAKAGRVSEYRGKTYYFCADECKQQFDQDPKSYVEKSDGSGKPGGPHGVKSEQQAKDLVCGKMVIVRLAAKPTTMSEYRGTAYYFCCPHCKASFDRNPDQYVK
jgi:Cu(I)/Ag(I) efflux system membrane fusion protein